MIINAASDAVMVIDENRRIVFFNAEAERTFGYTSVEALGQDLDILVPDRFTPGHARHVQQFVEGVHPRRLMSERPELIAKRKDGSEFPVEITLSKVVTPLGTFATAIVRDITKRKLAEQALKRSTEQLQASNAELIRLDEIKNQFLGMAAHDLRNPLIRIKTGAEMLMDDTFSAEQRSDLLRIIHSAAELMLALISDLLDVNRIESGRLELHKQSVDCRSFLEEIREAHTLTAQRKHIALNLEVDEQLGSVDFDQKRMQQVLENLLSNAIKFSESGTTVTITAHVRDKWLEISVRDQGVGISQAEIPKLFGAFQQLSSRATAGEKGTGLGLLIAKKIVELHGGSIRLSSEEGVGSEFTVAIPA